MIVSFFCNWIIKILHKYWLCRSDWPFVRDVLYYVIEGVFVLALLVFASSHKVKKTRYANVYLLIVRKTARLGWKFAFSQRIVDTSLSAEVVRETTFVALGTIIFVIEFAANFFGGFWLDDLSLDGVRKKTVETVFAVSHVKVDAWIVATINMHFSTLALHVRTLSSLAFTDSEVLVSAESFDVFKFAF